MPRLYHCLVFESGEIREWVHEEGERGALEASVLNPGCLVLSWNRAASGEWVTEFHPWHRVRQYSIQRLRSKRARP